MTSPDQNNIFNSQEQNARNTFYVSDSQRQKQSLFKSDFHKPHSHNRGNGGGPYYAGAGNSASRQVQRVMWNGPGAQDNQPPASSMVHGGGFTKPRALSRQADAHIKIEVHRDRRILNQLQPQKLEPNMNLMFYDFNGSAFGGAANTQQNFYKAGGQIEEDSAEPVQRMNYRVDGDRVPTRERGYRSANQNGVRLRQKQKLATAQRQRELQNAQQPVLAAVA